MSDDAEVFKAGVHLAVACLATTCAAYNAMAWSQRRKRHNAINVAIYAALALWEGKQIVKHLERVMT